MDPIVKHWLDTIERICANSTIIELAQGITPDVSGAYGQFTEEVAKVKSFLANLQDLVDGKMSEISR